MGNSKYNGKSTGYGASSEDGSQNGFCSITIPSDTNNLNFNVGGFNEDLVVKVSDGRLITHNGLDSVRVKKSSSESNDSTWVQPKMTKAVNAGGDSFATSVDGQSEISGFESYKLFDGLSYTYGAVGSLEGHLIDYTIPTLTSNGTLGGSSFAVAITECTGTQRGGQAYLPFGGTNDNQHYIGIYGNEEWKKLSLVMYTEVPTIMKSLTPYFIIINEDATDGNIYGLQIYGSNDNSTWTNIYEHINYFHVTNSWTKGDPYNCYMTNNNTAYQYYKLVITTSGQDYSDAAYISKIEGNLYKYSDEAVTSYSCYYYPTPIKMTQIKYSGVYEDNTDVYGMQSLKIDAAVDYDEGTTTWVTIFNGTVDKTTPTATISNTGYYRYFRVAGSVDSTTGGLYPVYATCEIVATTSLGKQALGEYSMFVKEDGTVNFESSAFYRQKYAPSSPANGVMWEDTSRHPVLIKKYNSSTSSWETYDGTYVGYTYLTTSGVSKMTNEPFCSTNTTWPNNCRPASIIDQGGDSDGKRWYVLYSDGWIQQYLVSDSASGTFTFFKEMSDVAYIVESSKVTSCIRATTQLTWSGASGSTCFIVSGYIAKKAVTRLYYKYQYIDWAIPTLTSNGSFGGSQIGTALNFSGCDSSWGTPYKVFSPYTNRAGFYCDEYKGWMYVSLYLPNPTNISYISFQLDNGWSDAASGAYNTKFYAGNYKNDRSYCIKDIGYVAQYNFYSSNISHNNYYKYFTLYMENGGGAHEDQFEIRTVYVSGKYRTSAAATSSDYDYYVDL